MRKLHFLALAAIGLLVRIIVAPLSGHPFDGYVYYDTGQTMLAGRDFYGVTQYSYPPLWAGIVYVVASVHQYLAPLLGAHPMTGSEAQALVGIPVGTPLVVDWLFQLLMKIPLIIFDTLLGGLLYRIVARRFNRPDRAQLAFLLFYLNPFVLWISVIWGTFDTIPTYFAIVGTLLFLDKRGYASGAVFGVAIAFKYYPAILLLSLILGMRRSQDRRFVKDVVLATLSVLAAVSIPFLLINPVTYAKGILSPASGVFLGNLSIWAFLPVLGLNDIPAWIALLNILLIVAAVALFSWVLGSEMNKPSFEGFWIDLSVLSLLLFYVLFRIVNDQYVFWIIPLLTLDAALGRERLTSLFGVSLLVLLAGLVNVAHYSFFLPMLTISPSLLGLVPKMWNIPVLRIALGVVFWFMAVFLLWSRVRRVAGPGEVLRFFKSFVRSLATRLRAALGRMSRPSGANPKVCLTVKRVAAQSQAWAGGESEPVSIAFLDASSRPLR